MGVPRGDVRRTEGRGCSSNRYSAETTWPTSTSLENGSGWSEPRRGSPAVGGTHIGTLDARNSVETMSLAGANRAPSAFEDPQDLFRGKEPPVLPARHLAQQPELDEFGDAVVGGWERDSESLGRP